ncbi:hypothetical protein KY358_01975 [Candidatus Woesearchaeota archaeon]|nr:hypothetical protein [Candidatus Woesearchaeota archaeon]
MPKKRFWRCNVCNDIHYGVRWPSPCPTCSAEKAYVEIEMEDAKNIIGSE